MRMPHMNLSPVTMSRTYGHYLLIRLQAVPEVAAILEYFITVRGAVTAAINAYDEAVLARQAAMAVRDFQNDKMDEQTRILAFTILGRVRNNRRAPIFRNYFPRGYSEILQTPINEQRRRSVVLLEKLEAEQDDVIQTRLEPFRVQLEAMGGALEAYERARDDEAIDAFYPNTDVQLCIVHMVRNSLKYVNYKDRREVAKDLKKIYKSPTVEAAEILLESFSAKWDSKNILRSAGPGIPGGKT